MSNRTNTRNIVLAGLLIAIGIIVPAIFHTTGIDGRVFLPMHIPVLLGGFLLSPLYAFLVGVVTPLVNSLLTSMPPLFPTAIIMMFELGVYGLIASYLYRDAKMPLIISLILSMIAGRLVASLVTYVFVLAFSLQIDPMFILTGGILFALPGIIIQIILIPLLMHGIERYTTINLD